MTVTDPGVVHAGGSASPSFSRSGVWVIVAMLALWGAAVSSRVLWNGEVYGLDFRLYHPDGACYTQMAFDFVGRGHQAYSEISRVYRESGSEGFGVLPDSSGNPSVDCPAGLHPRILYPLLSAPFVYVIGVPGMLVVPAISWLSAVLIPAIMLVRRRALLGAALAGGLALASGTLGRWGVSNTVDPLLMGLVALSVPLLPLFANGLRRRGTWLLLIPIVIAGSLVRQSFPVWIALGVGPWLAYQLMVRRNGGMREIWKNPWTTPCFALVTSAIASWWVISRTLGAQNGAFVLTSWVTDVAGVITSSTQSGGGADAVPPVAMVSPVPTLSGTPVPMASPVPTLSAPPIGIPVSEAPAVEAGHWPLGDIVERTGHALRLAAEVVVTEIGELIVLDRALLILLVCGLIAVWRLRRWPGSFAFLAVLLATLAVGAVNSTLGINFRFQLPVIPLVVLVAGAWISRDKLESQLWVPTDSVSIVSRRLEVEDASEAPTRGSSSEAPRQPS